MMGRAVLAGIVIGITYTLSPLFVLAMLGFALLLRWARQTADGTERRWLIALLVVAVSTRLVAIATLFLITDHETTPFGRLFGDEEYFIRRGIWLANLAVGIPISLADVKYAYDELIHTSFVWMLASLNVLVGPAQYGVRAISALIYLTGTFTLYRIVRPSFGRAASLAGLALLLFLPSLFVWSISVLKEPVFFGVLTVIVALTMAAGRRRSWAIGLGAAAVTAAAAYAAETIRSGGAVVAVAGTAIGVAIAAGFARPRVLAAAAIVAIIFAPVALTNGRIQDRLTAAASAAARRHWDHVNAPGHSYTIFDPAFYRDEPSPRDLTASATLRLVVGGVGTYLTVPAPWQLQSRAELLYLPEQVIWYVMVLLLPIGVVAGFRRDSLLTSVLLGHLLVSVALVALTSGNIGTLVRHRALAMPYVVWFSGLGLTVVLAWLAGAQPAARALMREAEA